MFLKAQFTPKKNKKQKMYPQIIQDIDEFVSSQEQIWRNVALHYLLTKGSSAVNGCRQNESSNTAFDKKHYNISNTQLLSINYHLVKWKACL